MSTTQTGAAEPNLAAANGGGSGCHNTPPAAHPAGFPAAGRVVPLARVPAGRVNGVHAEPGTVLGPKVVTREFVVVTDNDDHGVTVGYATTDDIGPAAVQRSVTDPRSVTEALAVIAVQAPERDRLRALFGPLRPTT